MQIMHFSAVPWRPSPPHPIQSNPVGPTHPTSFWMSKLETRIPQLKRSKKKQEQMKMAEEIPYPRPPFGHCRNFALHRVDLWQRVCTANRNEGKAQAKKKNSSGVALQISLKVQKVTTSGMSKFIVSKPHRPNSGSARSPKCIWKNQIGCNSRPRNFGRIKNPTVGHPWPCFDDQAGGGVSRPSIKDQGSILSSLRNPWAHCNWVNLPRFNSHRSFNSNLMKICKLRRGCWGPEGGSGGGSQEGNGFFSRSCVKCSTPF